MPRTLRELIAARASSAFRDAAAASVTMSSTQTETETVVVQSQARHRKTSGSSASSSSVGSISLYSASTFSPPPVSSPTSPSTSTQANTFNAPPPSPPTPSIESISISAFPEDDDGSIYTAPVLTPTQISDTLVDIAHPYTAVLALEEGIKADGVSFQPCPTARSQDRYVVEQLDVPIPGSGGSGGLTESWTLTGVFDGHLGETTVEHVAHHLPIIVLEQLTELAQTQSRAASSATPSTISTLLTRAITTFDASIANDVLALFPGGLAALAYMSDAQIRAVINDLSVPGVPTSANAKGNLVARVKGKKEVMSNYRKVQLNMYGTTALIALVDPRGENLWVANVGDCQGVLATRNPHAPGGWDAEMLTAAHNGSNPAEVARVRREHPGEPECILDGRVLGAIAPFRCLGDQPFKLPPEFTRRILYNLDATPVSSPSCELPPASSPSPSPLLSPTPSPSPLPQAEKARAISPWERFLVRNHTPPYISAEPDVVHRPLRPVSLHSGFVHRSRVPNHFLVLCSDGLQDLYTDAGVPHAALAKTYVDAIVRPSPSPAAILSSPSCKVGGGEDLFAVEDNLALRLLRDALGGDDCAAVSQLLQGEPGEEAWIDDVTVVVHVL